MDINGFLICEEWPLIVIITPRNVAAAQLPDQDQEWDEGQTATVSGWGTLSSGGSSPDTLHAVNVPIVSDASKL